MLWLQITKDMHPVGHDNTRIYEEVNSVFPKVKQNLWFYYQQTVHPSRNTEGVAHTLADSVLQAHSHS